MRAYTIQSLSNRDIIIRRYAAIVCNLSQKEPQQNSSNSFRRIQIPRRYHSVLKLLVGIQIISQYSIVHCARADQGIFFLEGAQ